MIAVLLHKLQIPYPQKIVAETNCNASDFMVKTIIRSNLDIETHCNASDFIAENNYQV